MTLAPVEVRAKELKEAMEAFDAARKAIRGDDSSETRRAYREASNRAWTARGDLPASPGAEHLGEEILDAVSRAREQAFREAYEYAKTYERGPYSPARVEISQWCVIAADTERRKREAGT
jgi:Domain of unknown function (DUF4398)